MSVSVVFLLLTHLFLFDRGPGVRQLWGYLHPSVEEGWDRPLFVQCLRSVPQNERTESTPDQTQAATGEYNYIIS